MRSRSSAKVEDVGMEPRTSYMQSMHSTLEHHLLQSWGSLWLSLLHMSLHSAS